jgi:hypothetical protein
MDTGGKTSMKYDSKKRFLPINFRFNLFLVIFIVAVFTAVVIITLLQLREANTLICERMGLPAVEKASQLIDGDAFERLCHSLDKNDPFYKETQSKLLSLREEVNALYLYTMAPYRGTVWRFIIDGTSTPEEEIFSELGGTGFHGF